MRLVATLRGLGPIDLKSTARDPLLRWLVAFPIVFALTARWPVPLLVARISDILQFDLTPYYRPVLLYYLLLMVPTLTGMVVGFLLLDQRDDGTLAALLVTPLTLPAFLAYRMALPTLLSLVLTLIALPLSGLSDAGFGPLLLAGVVAAPLAPIFALMLGCFARNKVQGFALMKASGLVTLPPLVAYFIESEWRIVIGLVPTYWSPAVYWDAAAGGRLFPLYGLLGLAYEVLVLGVLLRRFQAVLRR